MNKMRVIGFAGGAVVIVAIILLALGFNAAPTAKGSTSGNVGMGEVQRYGALSSSSQKASVSNSTYAGMGDLRAG